MGNAVLRVPEELQGQVAAERLAGREEAINMRLIRFMGEQELRDLLAGRRLVNYKDHSKTGKNRTDSVGFCFFDTSETPEERMQYLTGIVSMDAVIEIETDQEMKKGYGEYADPENRTSLAEILMGVRPKSKTVTEYSTRKYSLNTVKLIRMGRPSLWPHRITWEAK